MIKVPKVINSRINVKFTQKKWSRTTINVKFDYIFMRLSTISWMQSGNLAKGSSPNMNSNNRDKGLQILDMECVDSISKQWKMMALKIRYLFQLLGLDQSFWWDCHQTQQSEDVWIVSVKAVSISIYWPYRGELVYLLIVGSQRLVSKLCIQNGRIVKV